MQRKTTLNSLQGSAADQHLYCSHFQDACFLMTRLNNNNEDPQIEKWFNHATNFNTDAYNFFLFFCIYKSENEREGVSRLFVPLTADTGSDFKSHPEHGRLKKKSSRSISRPSPPRRTLA